MGFNWGGFSQGLSQGINDGMRLGSQIRTAMDRKQDMDVRKQATDEAKQAWAANEIAAKGIKPEGLPQSAAQDALPQGGGATYAIDAPGAPAQPMQPKAAKKNLGSEKQFVAQAVAERLEQHYIEKGDLDNAEQWGKWRKDKANERKMEDWASAYTLSQRGDYMGAAKKLIALHSDYDDGNEVVSATAFKDANGNEAGFDMVYRGPDGTESHMKIGARELVDMGLPAMNPQAMYQMSRAKMDQADQLRAKVAADAANDARTLKKEVAVEGVKAGYKAKESAADRASRERIERMRQDGQIDEIALRAQLDQAGVGAKEQAALNVKVAALRKAGKSEEEINAYIPVLVGADKIVAEKDPTSRAAMLFAKMAETDLKWSKYTPEEQAAKVRDALQAIEGSVAPSSPKAKPAPARKPVQTASAAGATRRTRYDPATKSMVPY